MNFRTILERLEDMDGYPYRVEVSDISVPAFVWLRNNRIPYTETLDAVEGEVRRLVWFQDQEHAIWFQLKWGGQ